MHFNTIVRAILVIGVCTFSIAWAKDPLERFSVSSEKMQEFTQKCVRVPSESEIEKEVQTWIDENRKFGSRMSSVLLDGFPFQHISENDFNAMRDLTIMRGAYGSLKDLFRLSVKTDNGKSVIERACMTEACGAKEKEKRSDLSVFQKSRPPCSNALCGAKRIFGEDKGLLILWSYIKFGMNLSPLSDMQADPGGLDVDTLRAILGAATLVPEHLRGIALKDTGFFRFLKGSTLPFYKGQKVVANAFGGVFDPIDELTFSEKVYFFIHELAHRARLRELPSLDESLEWRQISERGEWASKYAKVNAFEDFAESYTLYRLDPTRLKKISPERYSYFKRKVFDGLEFEHDVCAGSRSTDQAKL